MGAICRARLLSDLSGQTACNQAVTSSDRRLCTFHSRQCHGKFVTNEYWREGRHS
ncbi:hypothetical protein GQ44DRAFT_708875 [Phaeosphaeriaceae sp. PMI808]|nr:hypothetical protein GQ44DRAFT_708875 [Phaeosphaeriaceae sp. PMI808]